MLALFAGVVISPSVEGQEKSDTVEVVAGERYDAKGAKRLFLGSTYRDLWVTPVRVPVLRPDTAAGGLTVIRRGNSEKTASLLFLGDDGLQYFFRSVEKRQSAGLPLDLRNTVVEDIVQDLVSAKHPGAAVVVAPLLEAAGVLHPDPRLAMMADHPLLGEHREEFAGQFGMFEERPEEGENGAGFGGFDRIIGADRLLERLEESPEDRVDARAYLTARMVDFLVGDWDRHPDQWRWAEEERGGTRYWLPVPRDRDNAMSSMNGVISVVASAFQPTVIRFGPRYDDPYALVHNAQSIDRRVLPELPLAVWDSIALEVRHRLTDDVIADAVSRLPPAWREMQGEQLATALRARRDLLPEVARAIYLLLSTDVDIYATDEPEIAEVERRIDGSVRVRVSSRREDELRTYFDRDFLPGETEEVRLHMLGGADTVVVLGSGGKMVVRVIGGGGDDQLRDESKPLRGGFTVFHDSEGENAIHRGPRTRIDPRAYESAAPRPIADDNPPPPRDWGRERTGFLPTFRWPSIVGPVIGGGPAWTRYGFRREPFASQLSLALLYAPLHTRFGVEASARVVRTGGTGESRYVARATQISATRFTGFGNETPDEDDSVVWGSEFGADATFREGLGSGLELRIGPLVRWLDPDPAPGSAASVPGVLGGRAFGIAGGEVGIGFEALDSKSYPQRGARADVYATGYPILWGNASDPFMTAGGSVAGYLPIGFRFEPTLAARVGTEHAWGPAPFQYAPAIGGGSTLRGYPARRFTGDASIYGSVELRTVLGRANLVIARPEVGAIALFDVGRVFVSGEDSGRWHTGYGGGVSLALFERDLVGYLLYAYGERHMLYAGVGLPF